MFQWELDLTKKYFDTKLQKQLNDILYKLSRRYKNPAVFQFDKDGEDLSITMSGIWGKWDESAFCEFYGNNADFRDYYNKHDMLILVNQVYNCDKNTVKMDIKNSFEFGLDKFMPVVYIEYRLKNEENIKNFLINVCLYVDWYDVRTKQYKKGYK